MTVIIQPICSDEQCAGVSHTFAFAVLKSCGNLRRSLLAFKQLRCWLLYVTNCAFYLIRLLASLSNGNECAVPKTGRVWIHCSHVVFVSRKTVESRIYCNNWKLYGRIVLERNCNMYFNVNASLLVEKNFIFLHQRNWLFSHFLRWTNDHFSVNWTFYSRSRRMKYGHVAFRPLDGNQVQDKFEHVVIVNEQIRSSE